MNDADIIRINERHGLYDFRVGKSECWYVIDLLKPAAKYPIDRGVEGNLRWIPTSVLESCIPRFIKGKELTGITREEFFSTLMTELPDVFEFLIWHPELL